MSVSSEVVAPAGVGWGTLGDAMRSDVEGRSNGRFPATRSSVLGRLKSGDANERARSLEQLAAIYWRPIYGHLRLKWRKSAAEAEEIAQEFFLRCIDKGILASYMKARGRFRTFVRVCLDRFVLDLERHDRAEKRGGGLPPPTDVESLDPALLADPAGCSPEQLFEAAGLRSVVESSIQTLRDRCTKNGKDCHFSVFERIHLRADAGKSPSYADVANELGISIVDVTNRLSYARRQLRAIILETLRATTVDDQQLRDEARVLLGVDL